MYFKSVKIVLFSLGLCSAFVLNAKESKSNFNTKGLKKPVCFVENLGQITDDQNNIRTDIKYKLSSQGLNLFLGKNQLLYQFKKTEGTPETGIKISGWQMSVTLVGANLNASIVSEDKQDYHENYYTSSTGTNGITVNSFKRIVYKNIYQNIDWVVYVKDNNVEYDFIVNEGGNPKDIKIEYDGTTALRINENGGITAETPMGKIEEKKPLAYENTTGKTVASKFNLNNNIISFETGNYSGALTIDPYLSWSTYFGGNLEDEVTSITSFGPTGLLYAAGYTTSTTGVSVAIGLPFNVNQGGIDAFIAAYNSAGILAWATYFGGAGDDKGTGIAIDGGGNLYLTGYSNSSTLGSPGTYQPTFTSGIDAFLAKFSNIGVRQWSTYYGGAGDDYANGVACDAAGDIYIVGETNSPSGIMSSPTVFQPSLNGPIDGFFAKFTSTGTTVAFSSYFGGLGSDKILGVRCDATGNFVFTGETNSISNIATTGAYDSVLSGTNNDAFVESFSTTGTRNWGTYFGGTGTDGATGITCDGNNNIAIIGNTTSAGIATTNAYQTTFGGVQDAFAALFTSTGSLVWSTYFGGTSGDYGTGIAADNLNNIAICGYTLSLTGIANPTSIQPNNAGGMDAFVAKLDPLGRKLWSSYFGGTFNDFAYSITCDVNNLLTFGGTTGSSAGLYSAGGIASSATVQQPAWGGGTGTTDGFIAQFTADTAVLVKQPFTDTLICSSAGSTFTVSYVTNSILSTTLTVQLSDASGSFPASLASNIIGTTVSTTLTGTISCTIPTGLTGTGYRIRIISTNPAFVSPDDFYNIDIVNTLPLPTLVANTPVCLGQNEYLKDTASYPIATSNWTGPNGFTSAVYNPSITAITMADSGMYIVTITHNGCLPVTDSILVVVDSVIPPTPTGILAEPACFNYPLHLFGNPGIGTGPFTFSWTGPGGFTSTLQNPVRIDTAGNAVGWYYIVDTLGGCPSAQGSLLVNLNANSTVSINITVGPNDTVCRGDSLYFNTNIINGGPDPQYQWMKGVPDTQIIGAIWDNYSSKYLHNNENIYCILTSDAPCAFPIHDTSNVITVYVIDSTPVVYITADSNILRGQSVTFTAYAVYPGTISVFQWYVNDTLILGANLPTYTIPSVLYPISVKAQVFSPARCANPNTTFSNTITVHFNTVVGSVSSAFKEIELYPNPNNGSFVIKGALSNYYESAVNFEILNTVGQVVLSDIAKVQNNEIHKAIDIKNLSDGIYILHVTGSGEYKTLRFTVAH